MRGSSLLAAVIAVALLCGCISQQTFTAAGLVVEDFSPDFATVFPSEEVRLSVLLRNTGSVDAEVKGVEITGIDLKSWKEKTNTCKDLVKKPVKAGSSANCAVALVTPDTGNLDIAFSPKIHVTYSYISNALALVSVGTMDEVRRTASQGGGLLYKSESSGGPVSIDIRAASPVRVAGSIVEFPVRISVTNGPGTVCSGKCGPSTWNRIKLTLDTALKSSDCPGQIELALYKGHSNSFVCNLAASPSDAGAGMTQKRIEVRAEYEYIIQKETSIAIRRRTI